MAAAWRRRCCDSRSTGPRPGIATRTGTAVGDPRQLPLLHYDYGTGVVVLSQMGELTARDLRVMSVVSQVFWANGCPPDNTRSSGDEATLGFDLQATRPEPRGYVKLVKASVERLATTKVLWKINNKNGRRAGFGHRFRPRRGRGGLHHQLGIAGRKKIKGVAEVKNNFVIIDPLMAQMIRLRRLHMVARRHHASTVESCAGDQALRVHAHTPSQRPRGDRVR